MLNVRDNAKQAAAKLVAARRAQVAEAEAELRRREQAVADCRARQKELRARMLEELAGGMGAGRALAGREFLDGLREQESDLTESVGEQQRALGRAEAELEKSVAALIEASREVQVIEKHREEWLRRARRAEQRGEQKISDEIGAIMHGRRRKGDE